MNIPPVSALPSLPPLVLRFVLPIPSCSGQLLSDLRIASVFNFSFPTLLCSIPETCCVHLHPFHEFRRPAIVSSAYVPSSQAPAPAKLRFLSSLLQEALLIHHGYVQIHFLLSPLRAHCSFCHAPKVRLLFIMHCSPHLSPSRLQVFVWLFSSLNAKFSRVWSSSYSSL